MTHGDNRDFEKSEEENSEKRKVMVSEVVRVNVKVEMSEGIKRGERVKEN